MRLTWGTFPGETLAGRQAAFSMGYGVSELPRDGPSAERRGWADRLTHHLCVCHSRG